jgi:uncharacterized membrane protein YjdF
VVPYYFLSFKNKIKWGTTLLHRKCGEKLYQKVAMNHYSLHKGIGRHNHIIASCELIVIVLHMEVIIVKRRNYPFSVSLVDDGQVSSFLFFLFFLEVIQLQINDQYPYAHVFR